MDDSNLTRLIIRTMLTNEGIKDIHEAIDGVEGIKKFKENKPDIVLMDLMMPNKSGIEAIKEIKKQDPDAKIIVISSFHEQDQIDETKILGVNAFIEKPINKANLIEAIKKIVDKK